MNSLARLYLISQKPVRRIIGLMSGTSLDGLDLAVCEVHGHGSNTQCRTIYFETKPYNESIKESIRRVFAKDRIDFATLAELHIRIPELYANLIHEGLNEANIPLSTIDLIASHGQTVFHQPKLDTSPASPFTFQIGDGDHLAYKTGIITVSDFRQKHVAAGGEGAPLAIYADRILFTNPTRDRVLLNMGGIANFTFLPSRESKDFALTYDTGPANTLIDQYCLKYLNCAFDKDGRLASAGNIIPDLLNNLLAHPYFKKSAPKSTGQETFHLDWVENTIKNSSIHDSGFTHLDVVTTLSQLTIRTISDALNELKISSASFELFASGGGIHNVYITTGIERATGLTCNSTEILGILPDAKEAIMMVILANETISGLSPNATLPRLKHYPEISFGKISFPD